METNNINITHEATVAIRALQHKCGTFHYYNGTLKRLSLMVLRYSDEIGMSDAEALATLRALWSLRVDLADIAGPVATMPEQERDSEETSRVVEETFEPFDVDPDDEGSDAEAAEADTEKETANENAESWKL